MDSGSVTDCNCQKESSSFYLFTILHSHAIALEPTRISSRNTRNIQMIRDKTFYGFKSDNLKTTTKKSIPWVDVSDDEDRGKRSSMKRKANGLSHHHAQNGHKHKKHRGLNNNEVDQMNDDIISAGPSPSQKHMQNGAAGHTSQHHAKAIQEQRMQLPIAKGIVRLLHKTQTCFLLIYGFMTGRDALIEKLRKNNVTVLLGETGSGKTTRALTKSILLSLFQSDS